MRIALCTPFSRRSAIALSSRETANALSCSLDVVVAYPDVEDPLASDVATAPGLRADRAAEPWLRSFDHVVYVIADSPDHGQILTLSRLVPGIVILVDINLAQLAWSLLGPYESNERWLQAVRTFHGSSAAQGEETRLHSTPMWQLTPTVPRELHFRPLALARANAVVVRSEYAARLVRSEAYGIPTRVLSMPSSHGRLSDARERRSSARYAEGLVDLMGEVDAGQPLRALVNDLAHALSPMQLMPNDPVLLRTASVADELFGQSLAGPPVPVPLHMLENERRQMTHDETLGSMPPK